MKYCLNIFLLLSLFYNGLSQEIIDIDVDSWLSEHQEISASIVWINGGNPISYNDWPSTLKSDLQTAVYGYMNNQYPWGLSGIPNVFVFDIGRVGVNERTAWIYYVSYVAQSITAEIKRLIPWSLDELNSTSLSVLFDSKEMLKYSIDFDAYQFKNVTPASPEYIYKFLENNALIGPTRLETISRVIEWCKCLRHYSVRDGETEIDAYYATWQYIGAAPVIRTIEGTVRNPGDGVLSHYTAGCHGTVQFIRTLLQTLNIPTRYVFKAGHAQPHFIHENLYMSHGDDPYNRFIKYNDVLIPSEELLIGNVEYQDRFGSQLTSEEIDNNIGYKTRILGVKYLSMILCNKRCVALSNGYSNQQCISFMELDREYTLEELNNLNFWSRIDNKISSFGGCNNNNNFTNYNDYKPTPSSQKSVLNFWFYGQYGTSVTNQSTRTITAQIIGSFDLRYVIPHFCLSKKATINYSSGSYVDFSSARTFQITAENGTQSTWTITLTRVNPNLMSLVQYNILNINGTVIDILIRVGNGGNVPVSESYVAYYLSTDANVTKSDIKIGEDYVPSIAAHWFSEQSLNIDVSTLSSMLQPGSYFVGFILDYTNIVNEADENDNIFCWGSPQLTISSNSPPNPPQLLEPDSGTSWSSAFNLSWQCTDPDPGDVLNYTLRIRRKGTTSWNTQSMGTQTSYTLSGWSSSDLGTYEWSIVASDGEEQSTSEIWEFTLINIVLSVTPPNITVGSASGTSDSFNIISTTEWTVVGDANWLNLSSTHGNGNGTITVTTTSANTSTSSRVATVTFSASGVSPVPVTVTQLPAEPTLSVTPPNIDVASTSGSTGSFTIVSNTNWTVTDNASWLDLSRSSGSGNGTLTVTTNSANPSLDLRTADITFSASGINSVIVNVNQAGADPSLTVSPGNRNVGSDAGSTTFDINSNVYWYVHERPVWLTFSAYEGEGNSTLTINYTANLSTDSRVGIINISTWSGEISQSVTVTQAGASSTLSVTPPSINLASTSGSTDSFSVFSNTSWEVADDATWLNLSSESGNGNRTLTVTTTSANTSTSPRTANITFTASGVNPVIVTVTQNGIGSMLLISPGNRDVDSDVGNTTFNINSNIDWYVQEHSVWLTFDEYNGTGNSTITVSYAANQSTDTRIGIITISARSGEISQTVTVTQTGMSSTLSVSPPSIILSSTSGATGTFDVSSNTSWTVTNNVTWLSLSSESGDRDASITITTNNANDAINPRTANIIFSAYGIEPIIVTVTQNGIGPTLNVSPGNQNVSSEAGTTTFNINSNTTWNVSDDATWLTISPTNGSNNGTFTATFATNTLLSSRVAVITISGAGINPQTVTVTQNYSNILIVTPNNQNVNSNEGSTSFEITSNINWSVSDDASWLTISPTDGSGNGILSATYEENTTLIQRVGTITITGGTLASQTVTVTQSEPPVSNTLSVSPGNQNVSSEAGSISFVITSNTNWSVSDDVSWLIISPTTGSGNNTLTATYTENTTSIVRVGIITISGSGVNVQTVTITQSCSVPFQPGLISGKQIISQGTSETYSISPVTGATSYTWTLPTVGWSGNSSSTSILITTNKDAISGDISVVANNDCGPSVPSTLYVEVGKCIIPQITLKWGDVLICSNVEDMFLSYQWYNGTMPIPGANDQYYVTSKQPGVYKVETIDKNGCREMSNEITIAGSKSLSVYPNPAKSSFTICIKDLPVGKVNLRIINSIGAKIMDIETEKADIDFLREIPVYGLDEGFYMIQIIVNQTYLYNSKIMVIK